jgi:hypothetical protein
VRDKRFQARSRHLFFLAGVIRFRNQTLDRFGNPDESKISTSYSERLNLSIRMHVRRFTRLTNAHSKTYKHHSAMTSLFVAFYNFCRKNMAIQNQTPAIAAGLTDHVWSIPDLLEAAK